MKDDYKNLMDTESYQKIKYNFLWFLHKYV